METFVLNQMEVFAGNPERNLAKILEGIRTARDSWASVAAFPELAVSGYLLGDEWENDSFVRECVEMNSEILAATRGIAAIWGNVLTDPESVGEDGRIRKYNAAFVAQDGTWVANGAFVGHTVKSLMPKYREFDDERHFFPLPKLALERGISPDSLLEPFEILVRGVRKKVGVVICEDMWDDDYALSPVRILKSKGAEEIVNLSASPYGLGKSAKRDRLLTRHSQGVRFHYVNNVGIQNNGKNVFVFDGGTSAYANGRKIVGTPSFQEAVASLVPAPSGVPESRDEIADAADALVTGIRAFMASIGRPDGKIVIGLSGGIDSAVVATLCVLALGKENVVGVNMPSRFNSETTRNLAAELAANLGVRMYEVPIEASVSATRSQLESVLGMPMDPGGGTLNFENVQARDRGSRVLAGMASMLGAVFTNNGNKTETALGYATLYGDVDGAFAPIADLYKTQVYELARHLNARFGPMIPGGIIDLVPSAELSDEQNVDEGKGDPFDYPRTDAILKRFIEWRRDPEDLLRACLNGTLSDELRLGRPVFPGAPRSRPNGGSDVAWSVSEPVPLFPDAASFVAEIERLWKSYKLGHFKRVQAPPIIAVSKRAFGFDLREAQNGVHFTRSYAVLKERLLALP